MTAAIQLHPSLKTHNVRTDINANRPPELWKPGAVDTMSTAPQEKTNFAASRPIIAKFAYVNNGKRALQVELIEAQNMGSQALQQFLGFLQNNFDVECIEFKKASHDAVIAYQKFEEKNKDAESWSFFRKMLSYAGSAAAVALGLASGGGAFGYIVFAAGAFNIGREVAVETGLVDQLARAISPEDQAKAEQIASAIKIGSAVIGGTAVAITGILAINAVQAANAVEFAKQIVTTTSNVGTGVANIVEGRVKGKAEEARVHSINTGTRSFQSRALIDNYSKHLTQMAGQEEKSLKAAQHLVNQFKEKVEIASAGG